MTNHSSDTEEDFQVIEETVLLECSRVRMVPRQQPGRLALLRLKDAVFCFQWAPEDESESPRRIPIDDGLSVVPDEDSGTLLLLLPGSMGVCWLFHFLSDGSPEAFALQAGLLLGHGERHHREQIRAESPISVPAGETDLAFSVLAGFAKVKQAYGRMLGFGRPQSRPVRKTTGTPRNPWIREDAIPKLPPSRRIPSPISPLIWRSFHESDGSLVDPDNLQQLIHCSVRQV